MKKEDSLMGKVVVITGASSGFGKGAARRFAEQGAHVVLAARRVDLIDALASECSGVGTRSLSVPCDVGKDADMRRLFDRAVEEFGRIDAWINNAGVGAVGRFDEVPLADHEAVIRTNLLGTIYGSWFALKQFKNQGYGVLINTASELGKMTAPYYGSYTASKHGIVGLCSALRQELREDGLDRKIRVCTVMPSAMDTPFFEHAANYTGHQTTPPPPVYDPEAVIETYVSLVLKPRNEVMVGNSGKLMAGMQGIAPEAVGLMREKEMKKVQMEKARPAPNTDGSVLKPAMSGSEVTGGWRKC